MDRIRRFAWMAASVWLLAFAQGAAAQGAAAQGTAAQGAGIEHMLAGNEAFRSGEFAAATVWYREALAAGYDSGLLRYNLGVAHYRLGEYAEAELALQRAAGDRELAALASYNLGLTSMAAGWLDDAGGHFERVLAISTDPSLTDLASRALDRLSTRQAEAAAAASRRRYREPDPPVGDLYFVIAARYGTDDNIYRSPSSAYVDLAQTGQPTIVPIKQSAGFMPVDLLVSYSIDATEQKTVFDFAYRLNGDFYDSEFSNADEITQRFELGAGLLLGGRYERFFDTTFFVATHDETNFDPDTGLDRDLAGQDISDRYSYSAAGMETSYEHVLPSWSLGFDTRIERRSYDNIPLVTPFSHEFYHVDFWVERSLAEATTLFLALDSYRREYDARRARDGSGVLSTANPTLEYGYAAVEIGAERRFGPAFSLRASFQRVERTDNFVGYADYSENMLRLALDYRPSPRARLRFGLWGRDYAYPNAFAFNDPIGGPLEIESSNAEIDFEYRFNARYSIWTEFLVRDESSTDPRLDYARNRAVVGLKWRL